jgi:hypothetical protein
MIIAVVGVITSLWAPVPLASGAVARPVAAAPAHPTLGAIDAPVSDTTLSGAGYGSVVVSTTWSTIEPSKGVFSTRVVDQLQQQINGIAASGLAPSLDVGDQSAPPWIYSLPGGTRFEDQYGDIFGGSRLSGNDVANAVTDSAVRNALGTYLAYLGSHLHGLAAVRLGGGPDNELRYPTGSNGSQSNAFWFYDKSSQSLLPASVKGWKPGTGTVAQATTFLNAYDTAIAGFGKWLVAQGRADFPVATKLELLLPGWGQRPGEVKKTAGDLLRDPTPEMNQGLDWEDLIPDLPGGNRVVAYSTYADATQGTSYNPDPAVWIHELLPGGVLEGGESTGNGQTGTAGEDEMFKDAQLWHWYVANWFFYGQSQTYQQVVEAFKAQ